MRKLRKENTVLYKKAFSGLSLLIVREFLIKILSVVPQVLLLRVLLPADFGVFAIISFIVNFASLFSDIGLNQAVIRKKNELTNQELSSVFFVRLFLSTSITVLLILFAPFTTHIYSRFTDQNILMLQVFSLTVLLYPIDSIITARLERDLNYKAISTIDISGIVVYYASLLFFAYQGFSVWSFIWAVFLKEIAEVFLAYLYKPWIPSLVFDLPVIKEMISFGKYLQVGNFVHFVQQSTIPLIAGIKTTPHEVGLLDWSSNIASVPRAITDNFGRVAFSGYSKLQGDIAQLSHAVEDSIRYLSIISVFFIVITVGFAEGLVRHIFTPNWIPALPALYWYVGGIFFLGGTTAMGQAIIILGKTKRVLIISSIMLIVEILMAYYLIVTVGFVGIAVSACIASFVLFFAYYYEGKKYGFSIHIGNILLSRGIILFFSIIVCFVLNQILPGSLQFFVVKLLVITIVYLSLCYFFAKRDLASIVSTVKGKYSL